MNTTKDNDFDYQTYVKENSPDPAKIQRGSDARKQRLETARMRYSIQLDEDIAERFQHLVPQGQTYDKLINQALREWLIAKNMKELLREDVQDLIQRALSSKKAV